MYCDSSLSLSPSHFFCKIKKKKYFDMKQIRLGSQYFFYMETQTALAVPDEDNSIVVYSSCQIPQYVHSTVATCLGIPENKVRVIARRVGGGFGGKAVKAMPVSFLFFCF